MNFMQERLGVPIHSGPALEDNWLWGAQPQLLHLQHNSYNLEKDGKIVRSRRSGHVLWDSIFYNVRGSCTHDPNNMVT